VAFTRVFKSPGRWFLFSVLVRQAFPDCRSGRLSSRPPINTGLESPVNRQAGKAAWKGGWKACPTLIGESAKYIRAVVRPARAAIDLAACSVSVLR